jgi:hypothetical protein
MRLAHSLSTDNHCQVASNLMSPPAEPGVYLNEINTSVLNILTSHCEPEGRGNLISIGLLTRSAPRNDR